MMFLCQQSRTIAEEREKERERRGRKQSRRKKSNQKKNAILSLSLSLSSSTLPVVFLGPGGASPGPYHGLRIAHIRNEEAIPNECTYDRCGPAVNVEFR